MEKRRKESVEANLPEDLIIDVLLFLPVKSIARFRCVCKSWNHLLTHDISFQNMKLHHDTRMEDFKLLLTTRNIDENIKDIIYSVHSRTMVSDEAVKIRYPFEMGCIQILGSCNGLICARKHDITYVWNPCTNEYKVILSFNQPTGIQTNQNLLEDYISYGFGYASKTCDYKFVSIFFKPDMDVSQVEIYSLGSESWKTDNSCIPYKIPNWDITGVFLHGALHWLANTGNDSQPRVILSFDVEDETFKEIPLPEHMVDDDFDYKFVDVLRGCLCLLCSVSEVGFEIWEMKDYGVRQSWSKLFKSDQQLMTTLDIPSYRYLRSAVHLPNGEILLQIRLCGDKDSSREWHKISSVVKICLEGKDRHQNRRKYRSNKYMIQMVPYMESLVSVKSGTRVGDLQEQIDYEKAFECAME